MIPKKPQRTLRNGLRQSSFLVRLLIYIFFALQVGWVRSDSKAILALHQSVITYDSRMMLSGDFTSTLNLHIKDVQEEDRGQYMCQINTDPMMYQTVN